MEEFVQIVEVSPRDGIQNEKKILTTEQKLELIQRAIDAGFKQIGVEYDRAERAAGQVKYTFKKLLQLALNGLFDFSAFPLRLATYLGLIVSFFSFFSGIFFLIHRIFDFKIFGHSPADVPGIASLALGVFFLGGVTLLVLGIIGEYLGRIYFEVKKRPFYIIEDVYEN